MGRHASADDGDINLDQTPDTSVDVVPGDVLGVGEMDERIQPDDRNDDDEDSDRKHGHDHELLLQAHVQPRQVFHWKCHDDGIEENVDGGSDPTLEMDIVTCAFVLLVPLCPGKADGQTLDQCCDEECNGVQYTYTHGGVRNHLELLVREDTEVEEQDGDLGDTEGGHVEDLAEVVVVEDVGDLVVLQRPDISTKTVLHHWESMSKL